jgi:invasion protein IalB
MKRVLALFSLIATYLVFVAGAVEAASDPRAMQLTYEPWAKFCLGNSVCFVGAGARGTCYPSGGVLAIAIQHDGSLSLSVTFERMLEGAIGVRIDQDTPISISHPECRGIGSSGKYQIDSEFIERLKRSHTITIEATTTAHQKLSLSLSLAGFAEAYDGPGTEPKAVEEVLLSSDEMTERMKQAEKTKLPQCEE